MKRLISIGVTCMIIVSLLAGTSISVGAAGYDGKNWLCKSVGF